MEQNTIIPNGLTQNTAEVFWAVSQLDCIKDLYLCGGTAQAILMDHRQSEDLDFELLGVKKERKELDFNKIINDVKNNFPNARTEILGEDHLQMFINDNSVKLSFFRPENPVKYIHEEKTINNIHIPSLQDLLGMKLYTIEVRTKTRDYYDIYCLLEEGCDLEEGIRYASHLSRHQFKSKDILSKLITKKLYPINDDFLKMSPKYIISSDTIQERMLQSIQEIKDSFRKTKQKKILVNIK